MAEVDFDFLAYVAARKGALAGQSRAGPAPYAFTGAQRRLHALARVKPVALAAEAVVKNWRSGAREALLGRGSLASEANHPEVAAALETAAARLRLPIPPAYVVPDLGGARALGTDDDAVVAIDAALARDLTPEELRFALGAACGQIQAGHVLYETTLHHLERSAGLFLRWVVRPAALALRGFRRRARFTTDRAGLLAARDLDAALSAIAKLDAAEGDGGGDLPLRAEALRSFARTYYYLSAAGDPAAEAGIPLDRCDAEVAALVAGGLVTAEAGDA